MSTPLSENVQIGPKVSIFCVATIIFQHYIYISYIVCFVLFIIWQIITKPTKIFFFFLPPNIEIMTFELQAPATKQSSRPRMKSCNPLYMGSAHSQSSPIISLVRPLETSLWWAGQLWILYICICSVYKCIFCRFLQCFTHKLFYYRQEKVGLE